MKQNYRLQLLLLGSFPSQSLLCGRGQAWRLLICREISQEDSSTGASYGGSGLRLMPTPSPAAFPLSGICHRWNMNLISWFLWHLSLFPCVSFSLYHPCIAHLGFCPFCVYELRGWSESAQSCMVMTYDAAASSDLVPWEVDGFIFDCVPWKEKIVIFFSNAFPSLTCTFADQHLVV